MKTASNLPRLFTESREFLGEFPRFLEYTVVHRPNLLVNLGSHQRDQASSWVFDPEPRPKGSAERKGKVPKIHLFQNIREIRKGVFTTTEAKKCGKLCGIGIEN